MRQMTKQRKTWVYNPKKPVISSHDKEKLTEIANNFVNTELKPLYIQKSPKDKKQNYTVAIYTKWQRNFLYFFQTVHSQSGDPDFDLGFARMEYLILHILDILENGGLLKGR